MREILFKSKTEGGRWIEGDLIHYESGEVAIFEKLSKYGYEVTEICKRTKVLSETICQYTGLKDKNGSKIWENDIVKVNDKLYVVHYYELFAMYMLKAIKNGGGVNGTSARLFESEVVGNVFDNPELIGYED